MRNFVFTAACVAAIAVHLARGSYVLAGALAFCVVAHVTVLRYAGRMGAPGIRADQRRQHAGLTWPSVRSSAGR